MTFNLDTQAIDGVLLAGQANWIKVSTGSFSIDTMTLTDKGEKVVQKAEAVCQWKEGKFVTYACLLSQVVAFRYHSRSETINPSVKEIVSG